MNDKISQVPGTTYLGLEQDSLMENHAWEQATKPRPHSHVPLSNTSTANVSEVSRHSGIFRFGKSIAATFNPNNWKLFSKQDRAGQDAEVENPQQKVLRERQEKAERIYAELKQTGHFPTVRTQNVELPVEPSSHSKHDSGISFAISRDVSTDRRSLDSQRSMSKEDKRKGMVFLDPPSTVSNQYRGNSPAISNFSTPSRTSFSEFRRASLSNIKKKFSYDGNNESVVEFQGLEHSARRIPSRKDLQKQQKLVKKVSNLEGKLEAARRQLNETLVAPPPPRESHNRGSRRRFVPGAMPTLPSERLLSGYNNRSNDGEEDDEENEDIGKAVFHDPVAENRQSLEDTRGRSRDVREPEISPSHFYPSSPLTKEMLLSQDRLVKTVELHVVSHEESDQMTSEVSVSTKLSKAHSLYATENEPEAEDSEDISAVDSSSVMSPSEPSSENEEVTPKAKRGKAISLTPGKSASTTPKKKVLTPTRTVKNTTNTTSVLRKRKALADSGGVYKPSGASVTGDSDVHPPKRQTSKRKSIGAPVQKLQNNALIPSPPRRLPPPPPTPPKADGFVAQNEKVNEKHAVATNGTINTVSNSSSSSKDGDQSQAASSSRVPPTRKISRKELPSSTSRVSKPKAVLKDHPRARQSVSPPPSASTFEPKIDMIKLGRQPDAPVSTSNTRERNNGSKESAEIMHDQNAHSTGRRGRVHSSEIPPMPRLPKTVRLPTGEVVDVKVKAPDSAPRASSRSTSRNGARDGSVVSTSRISKTANGHAPETSGPGEVNRQKSIPKSGTRESFEWPDDCF